MHFRAEISAPRNAATLPTTTATTGTSNYHLIMAINVRVISNLGEIRGEVTGVEINRLCEHASVAGMPMLGYVDEYDDTYFNLSQMRLVIPELAQLATSVPPYEAGMAQQLLDLARIVSVHDQMIFIGD
jgi:hypothetical protein